MYNIRPSFNFTISDMDDDIYLELTGPPPDAASLVAEIRRLNIIVDPDVLLQVLQSKPFDKVLLNPKGQSEPFSFNPLSIIVAPDKMTAAIIVKSTGFPVSIEEAKDELHKAGIVYGVDDKALLEAIKNPGKQITAASGSAPVDGQDSVVVMYYQKPEKKPVLLDDGRVNYYELGHIVTVHAGDIIALRTSATSGASGYNVLGEFLPALPGRDNTFPVGKGILVIDNKAIAEYDGALSWDKDKVSITKSIMINGDVDFSVGNLDFPGKVIITGNVLEGFKVLADDDIEIRGGVDDAEITSRNGSIFVQKGIIGRGKAKITARKNVEAKFIQEAVVEAGHNIVVNEYVIRCDMNSGNSVLIQGRKGKIMGNNNIRAKTKIKAAQIQNSQGLHLVVEGIQRSQYNDRIKELNSVILDMEKTMGNLTMQIRRLRDRTSEPESLIQLQKLLPEYFSYSEKLEVYNEERNLIANILKNTRGEGMIEIGAGLEQGMCLTIKDESINIVDNIGQFSMFFDTNEKRIKILSSKK